MNNLIQESPEPQIPEQPFDSRFSLLSLDPAAVDGSLCSSCGRRPPRSAATPKKRRSPTPSRNPTTNTKRPFLDPTSFSKIDLPIPFGPSSPLRRTVSDPTEACNFSSPPPPKRSSPTSALPPPPLRRTVSDPNYPSPDKTSESPIKIGRVNNSIKDNSPDSKRLRRIKDRLKELNQWCNEVMSEDDDRDSKDENEPKKMKEEDEEEETVKVERIGDSLELRLKCPCGKGFEILLSGTSCFYKLL